MRPSRNSDLIDALAVEIKARRIELGYTQEDLAGHCDLDRPYISLIEVGRKQPSLSVLFRIAIGLQFTLEELSARIERRYKHSTRAQARTARGSP